MFKISLFNQRSMKWHNLFLCFYSLLFFRKYDQEYISLKEGKFRVLDKTQPTGKL